MPRRQALTKDDFLQVDGRLGVSHIRGKAIQVLKIWKGWVYNLPDTIPVEEEVVVGGRRWIVKDSTLGVGIGYGLFACEDIDVPNHLGHDMQYAPALFPYAGPIYSTRAWKLLLSQAPTWKVCVPT
jgi:hypothetical protein